MILPMTEVRNEVLADFPGGIFSGVSVKALPIAHYLKIDQSHGKQHAPLLLHFTFSRLRDLCLHPLALHARR